MPEKEWVSRNQLVLRNPGVTIEAVNKLIARGEINTRTRYTVDRPDLTYGPHLEVNAVAATPVLERYLVERRQRKEKAAALREQQLDIAKERRRNRQDPDLELNIQPVDQDLPFSDEFRVGVRVKVFNANLHAALRATGKVRVENADDLGIPVASLSRYVNFRSYPSEERKLKIAMYLKVPVDTIFPEEIAGLRIVKEPEPITLTSEEARRFAPSLIAQDLQEAVEDRERNEAIDEMLNTLSVREERIIRARYGLNAEWESKTLDRVAYEEEVTRERIRQIESMALRKLRHPTRSRGLLQYLT